MTEDQLLAALFERLPSEGSTVAIPAGDDCAGLMLESGQILLVAADQLIGNRHYVQTGPGAVAPELAGRKLLARNVSDIAAMGGRPLHCLICATFGPDVSEEWMRRFHDGIFRYAEEIGVDILGGDLGSASHDTVCSLTILGTVPSGNVVCRSGARDGDVFLATGTFGRSLQTGHHLTFEPRLPQGRWLAENSYANAMIDVSDGLVLDASRLCRASGVGLRLDVSAIPLRTPDTSLEDALSDGEDYELLLAVSPGVVDAVVSAWPFADAALTRIGVFGTDIPVTVCGMDGTPLTVRGFDHFEG